MPGSVALQIDEMRRARRAQLDSILGRASSSGGGLPQMGALPTRQHSDPKDNLRSLYGGYQNLQATGLLGSLPQSVTSGVAAGAAAPSLAAGTFSSIPAGAAVSAAPLTSGAATVGGSGALGAIGSGLSAAGSAIGAGASAAASGASSLIGALAALL